MAVCDPTITNIVPKGDNATPSISATMDNTHTRTADSDSDASDPNINLAVEDALVEEEEQLMKEEETKKQFENQMLAVALMKSVVDVHPPATIENGGTDTVSVVSGGTKMVSSSSSLSEEQSLLSSSSSLQFPSFGNDTTKVPTYADPHVKKDPMTIAPDNGTTVKVTIVKPTIQIESTVNVKHSPRKKKSPRKKSSPAGPDSPDSTDGIYMGTRKRRRQGDGDKEDDNCYNNRTPAGATTPTTTNKTVTTTRYTGGNHITSIAKGSRRLRKRGEDSSTSPRSRRNTASITPPSSSTAVSAPTTLPVSLALPNALPPPPELLSGVPNPILPSPSIGFDQGISIPPLPNLTASGLTLNENANVSIKMETVHNNHASNVTAPDLNSHVNSLPTVKEENGLMNGNVGENRSRSNSVTFAVSAVVPQRRRIFSIDIDPEALLLGDQSNASATQGNKDSSSAIKKEPDINSQESTSSQKDEKDSSSKGSRSRGMSFELFSFGVTHDESILGDTDSLLNGNTTCRPRGDSIIFDPSSFNDGGIHEETALLRSRNNSLEFQDAEMELLNIPGFVDPQNSNILTDNNKSKSFAAPPLPTITMTSPTMPPLKSTGNSVRSHHVTKSSKSHYSYTSSSNGTTEDTIHMPQGSQAAAAAASLTSQIVSSTANGSVSHTSCPMELLNKAGRIGIYLPEARKERIAKFHSKRKCRIWRKRIKYDCRKKLADSRPRIKGRFVKSVD